MFNEKSIAIAEQAFFNFTMKLDEGWTNAEMLFKQYCKWVNKKKGSTLSKDSFNYLMTKKYGKKGLGYRVAYDEIDFEL